jgi:hypothetical protein
MKGGREGFDESPVRLIAESEPDDDQTDLDPLCGSHPEQPRLQGEAGDKDTRHRTVRPSAV